MNILISLIFVKEKVSIFYDCRRLPSRRSSGGFEDSKNNPGKARKKRKRTVEKSKVRGRKRRKERKQGKEGKVLYVEKESVSSGK